MRSILQKLLFASLIFMPSLAWGHGFLLNLNSNDTAFTVASQSAFLDAGSTPAPAADSNLFYETFGSSSLSTPWGMSYYYVEHGFISEAGPFPPPSVFTATVNMISPLYFSDGNAGASGAAAASAGTYVEMYDRDFSTFGGGLPGSSPGNISISGATPLASGFQVSLQDAHELAHELVIAPNSAQTYGEYGFAFDITLTLSNGTVMTSGPMVCVYGVTDPNLGDFADNAPLAQQDNATLAIYNAVQAAGNAVVGTTSGWSGANGNAWSNAANWQAAGNSSGAPNGGVPGSIVGTTSNDTVVFSSGSTAPVVDSGRNVQSIFFELNVGAMTLGSAAGSTLLLTNGGSIQVTSTVANAQIVNAPLVLEGANALYTFNSDSLNASASLSFGGSITGGAAGNTLLTLGGDNTGTNTISGAISNGSATSLAILENGPCNWILSGPNTYTGGTTVNQGTLTVTATGTLGSVTSPLTITTYEGLSSAIVNINGNQSVGTLAGTLYGAFSTASLNIAAGSSLTVNQAANTTFGPTLVIADGTSTNFGSFTQQGNGTLEIDAAPTLGDQSQINVKGGTLRFNVASGPSTIGAGVTVTIATAGTLQLAGSVAALSGGGTANIINNGSTASGGGLLVTGTNQIVGNISGTASGSGVTTFSGDTVVGDGTSPASLTAAQILQNSLTINASSTVTISPSSSKTSNIAGSVGASPIVGLPVTDAPIIDPDLLTAIQAAIASRAIGSQTGQRLENRIAAIERLQVSDPNFDVTALENDVLSTFDSEFGDFSDSSEGSNALVAPVGSIGSPAAVPEPSAFLLTAICALVMIFVARIQKNVLC